MMYTLVILSGGVGNRMNNPVPKQYLQVAGKPMIMHTLEKADRLEAIGKIVVVCEEKYKASIQSMIKQYGIEKEVVYAKAGESRQESVLSGIRNVDTKDVVIQEAARPFVTIKDYNALINDPCENVIFGVDIPFTVVKGHDYVEGITERSELINVQLPQKFNTEQLLKAHLKAAEEKKEFTEDSSLLQYYIPEVKIRVLKGVEYNIKVTTHMDLLMGEIIYDEVFRRRK